MGFDLHGSSKTEGSTYFRANVWCWRPIWKFVSDHCSEILNESQLKRGNYNDFVCITGVQSLALAEKLQSLIDDETVNHVTSEYEIERKKQVKVQEIIMKALDQWTEEQGASCGNDLKGDDHEIWQMLYRRASPLDGTASYPMEAEYIAEFTQFCKKSDEGFEIG